MYPFERFSDAAKLTLTLAQEEAERSGHGYVGTEHVVLALRRDPESTAGQVLAALGVSEDVLRERADAMLLETKPAQRGPHIVPTTGVKKAIEVAFEESSRARRREVTTGDMLVGVLSDADCLGAQLLMALGVRLGDVRAELALLSVAGVAERSTGRRIRPPGPASEVRALGEGVRVLVHDPDPPHRLWEGRVVAASDAGFEVEIPDRPAGTRVQVPAGLVHPVPSGPTFLCQYCRST